MNKIRTSYDRDRLIVALQPVDEAFPSIGGQIRGGASLLAGAWSSPATLASYRRGWTAYRAAITDGDTHQPSKNSGPS